MFDSARFREMLQRRGLSQSELARRVGVSQASIYRLAAGDAYGSKHIHRIARELQTTPAYLTGETDDPLEDAPDPPEITRKDLEFLHSVNALPSAARAAINTLVRALAGQDASAEEPSLALPSEAALTAMYQAQLQAFSRLQGDDLARALAKRLPKALARLQDVTTYEVTEPLDAAIEDAEPPATDHPVSRQARRK